MRFSSSLFHRLVTGTILIFLFLRSANGELTSQLVDLFYLLLYIYIYIYFPPPSLPLSPSLFLSLSIGIKCHSTDTNSINGTCESRLCAVYVQQDGVHVGLFQNCYSPFFCPGGNPNHIYINPGIIPYIFCCDYDWCNTIDKILPYISPSPSPTSSFGGQSSSLITSPVLSVWEAPPSTSTSSSRISQISSASNTLLAHTESCK